MTVHTLYRFFDAEGHLLYVGITGGFVWTRLEGHRHQSPWWQEVITITVEHYETYDEVLIAEWTAIQTESPPYNIQDNPLHHWERPPERRFVRVPRLKDFASPRVLERDAWTLLRQGGYVETDDEARRYIKRRFGYDATAHIATHHRCPWYDVPQDRTAPASRRLVQFAIDHGVNITDARPLGRLAGAYALYLVTERLVDLGMMGVGQTYSTRPGFPRVLAEHVRRIRSQGGVVQGTTPPATRPM